MYIQKLIVGSPIMYTVHTFLHMLHLFPPPPHGFIWQNGQQKCIRVGLNTLIFWRETGLIPHSLVSPFFYNFPHHHTPTGYIIWLFKHLMKLFFFFSKHTVRAPDNFALFYATAVKKKKTFGMNRKGCDVWKCHIDWLPCQKEIYLIHFNVAIKIRIEYFLGG